MARPDTRQRYRDRADRAGFRFGLGESLTGFFRMIRFFPASGFAVLRK